VAEVAEFAHEPAAVWIAREFNREPHRVKRARLRLISLWAWFSAQQETFGRELIDRPWTPDMHIGAAVEAADDWQVTIDLHVNLGRQPINDMWLQAGRVAGYDFLPLTSISDIIEEADAMRNCLKTYGESIAHNSSRVWSVRRNGERIATLGVARRYRDPLPNIVEFKAAGNADVPRELWWTARQWLHMHNLPQIDTERRKWGTAPLDRATWLSLWRPYWLAKRHIPEWLPVSPSRDAFEGLGVAWA
jgi:hypothetical protein